MFTIYPQIANKLRGEVPGLQTVDYDKGQLALPEKYFSLNFPAVLISVESVKWNDGGKNTQTGDVVVAVTVAINPVVQNTQASAPDIWKYITQMQVINDAYTKLKGYKGGDEIPGLDENNEEVIVQGSSFTALTRTTTQRMKRYDQIQAFTHVFTCQLKDNSAQPVYVKPAAPIAPVPPEIRAYTPNSVAVFPEELG
jgi:hypothetical protein